MENNILQSIVTKLEDQKKITRDIIVPAGHIRYSGGILQVQDTDYAMRPTDHTHEQIGDKLGIPRAYYRKMQGEYPELLESNINMWLSKKTRTQYLLRTFQYENDAICRALLSNKYNIIDNYDVLIAALEAIKKAGIQVEIIKAEVTDNRMYLHVVAPEIHTQATELLDGYLENRSTAIVDRGIISGMVISNSEIGMGTFEISARAQIMRCKNGLVDRSARFKRVHLGARMDEGDVTWSQNTKNKNYELIISQVTDAVKVYLSEDYLGQLTTKLQKAKEVTVEHPVETVTNVSTALGISDEHRNNILKYFFQDGDSSTLGVLQAVTRETQNMGADMQHEIEGAAFSLLPRIKEFDKPMSSN